MKHEAYAALVAARKACCACPSLVNPSAVDSGAYDSDRIGPYSRWHGNLKSGLVVVGQDFADVATFRAVKGFPRVSSNRNLVALLRAAGLDIALPEPGRSDDVLFLTNAVLCLKQGKGRGGMQARVPANCFRACGSRFLRPVIDLITPRAVATLGHKALNAVLFAYGLPGVAKFGHVVGCSTTFDLPFGGKLFPMAHPSPTVANVSRSFEQQCSDWKGLGAWLRAA